MRTILVIVIMAIAGARDPGALQVNTHFDPEMFAFLRGTWQAIYVDPEKKGIGTPRFMPYFNCNLQWRIDSKSQSAVGTARVIGVAPPVDSLCIAFRGNSWIYTGPWIDGRRHEIEMTVTHHAPDSLVFATQCDTSRATVYSLLFLTRVSFDGGLGLELQIILRWFDSEDGVERRRYWVGERAIPLR